MQKMDLPPDESFKYQEKSDAVSQLIVPYDSYLHTYFNLYRPPFTSNIKNISLYPNHKLLSEEQIHFLTNFILKDMQGAELVENKIFKRDF